MVTDEKLTAEEEKLTVGSSKIQSFCTRRQKHSDCIPGFNISSFLYLHLHDSTDLQKSGFKEKAGAHINLNKEITEALLHGHTGP